MKSLTLVIALVLVLCSGSAFSQDSYSQKLNEYLELNGSMPAFKAAIGQMLDTFRKTNTSVPAEFWDEVAKEMGSTSLNDLVALLEPVYKKHLSESDIDAIIAFYKTPAGKKLAAQTPAIMTESMSAGQTWGQAIGQKVVDKMKEKGYK